MEGREDSAGSVGGMSDIYSSNEPGYPHNDVGRPSSGQKRKAESSMSPPPKKQRLSELPQHCPSTVPQCVPLLPELWQHVFLHLDVQSLGRLLSVNRAFNFYLTSVHDARDDQTSTAALKLRPSESIWTASRKRDKTLPKPLIGFTELTMLQLIKGHSCQFCRRLGQPQSIDPWVRGPGRTGVRIVWAFGIRTCGQCLEARTQNDIKLMISSSSALLPGLPFVFITQDTHVVSATFVQNNSQIPPNIQPRKFYYTAHVQNIQKELDDVLALNSGIAEEWFKGLDSRKRERLADADRCERWEMSHLRSGSEESMPANGDARGWPTVASQPMLYSPVPIAPYSAPVTAFTAQSNYMYPLPNTPQSIPPPHIFQPPPQPVYGPLPHTPTTYHQGYAPPQPTVQSRPDRSIRDVTEAKALRRKDIEDRCMKLETPIPPKVLRHMDSFKAALQISLPMTDQGWEQLKPRLLAQRENAEQQERFQAAHLANVQAKAADRRLQEASQKEIKETQDRDWEDAQRPIRAELETFADEIIERQWDKGKRVTRDNSPQFAADVLLHVNSRFFENATPSNPDGPPRTVDGKERKLILENMKWVFDNKIKGITERFRKELFLCAVCEENRKFYGFEGVIQHYGAKHTNAFSVGNIVVHWKEAEWPDEPPFEPEPANARSNVHYPGYTGYGFPRGSTTTPQMNPQMSSQFSPAPGAGNAAGYVPGPFQPPATANTQSSPGFKAAQFQGQTGFARTMQNNTPKIDHVQGVPPAPSFTSPERRNPQFSEEQVSQFAEKFRLRWSLFSGVKDLPSSVRFHVTIRTLATAFKDWHGKEPQLDMLLLGFKEAAPLQGIKNIAGLDCKVCTERDTSISNGFPMFDFTRGYSILSLAEHFKDTHMPDLGSKGTDVNRSVNHDWTIDMIALPAPRFITRLAASEGMDDEKLGLLHDVFPFLFAQPNELLPGSAPIRAHPDEGRTPAHLEASDEYSPQRSPRFGPNEYDPRRPALDRNRSSARSRPRGPSEYHTEVIYVGRDSPRKQKYASTDTIELQVTRDHPEDYKPIRNQGYPDQREDDTWKFAGAGSPRTRMPREVYYSQREPHQYHEPEHRPLSGPKNHELTGDDLRLDTRRPREIANGSEKETLGQTSPNSVATVEEADRFLQTLMPEEHKPRADELAKQRQEELAPRPDPPELPGRDPTDVRRDDRVPRQHPDFEPHGPASYARSYQSDDGHDNGYAPAPRRDARNRPSQPRRRERDNEHMPASRYARYMRVYRDDPSYHGHRVTRPQSRYDRYEAQRRQIERSQSPSQRGSEVPENFRDRSLGPHRASQPSPLEPTPMRDDIYSPGPPMVRYQYAQSARPNYVDEYGRPIEYIRVHEPQYQPSRPRYVTDFAGESRHVYEYIPDHQGPPRDESVYYEPPPAYGSRSDRRPQPPPPPPDTEGSVYDPEPRATPAGFVEPA